MCILQYFSLDTCSIYTSSPWSCASVLLGTLVAHKNISQIGCRVGHRSPQLGWRGSVFILGGGAHTWGAVGVWVKPTVLATYDGD